MPAVDRTDYLSAALRHARDAEHLLSGPESTSRDQAWHIAGFAHECARKASVQSGWVPRILGHSFKDASDAVVDFAIALDPRAVGRLARNWSGSYPTVPQWLPDHRYERTGASDERPVELLVAEAREATDRTLVALFLDGSLDMESVR